MDLQYIVERTIFYLSMTEKHGLVFLSGQGDIEKAIGLFNSHPKRQKEWYATQCYGSLPVEE